jgi:hypothetical protein
MKFSYKNNIKKELAFCLLSLVLVLVVNNSLFTHVHVLENGNLVVHAHPFQKSGQTGSGIAHSHSAIEFQVLETLHHILFISFNASITIFLILVAQQPKKVKQSLNQHLLISFPGRSPPQPV